MTEQPVTIRSRRGRTLVVLGDPALLTMDRMDEFTARIDTDPRIATLSLVAGPSGGTWLRAAAPAGPLVAIATDAEDLVGPLDAADPAALAAWLRAASERGLWHDWWVTRGTDVAHAEPLLAPAPVDAVEADDPSSAHHDVLRQYRPRRDRLSVTVDVTWLGPYETGAQVLTTAALGALAEHPAVTELRLVGLDELPDYAAHLAERETVTLLGTAAGAVERTDVVWYPNQIDGRSSIASARRLGARVVTTYLDLIAYDIPRYHGDEQAWLAYRSLQRRIALTVDGITTISADVAQRLLAEVPRLDPDRVLPLPLGLDHITAEQAPEAPDEDLADVVRALKGKRFVLVLGNDFQHKNRDFAIRVWQQALQAGQPCDLVLAGLHVKGSSSKAQEDDLVARHLDLRGRVHTVGHVSSASRAWLLAQAAAVLYPSSAEGFGFVPYEAAALGTPSVFTDFGPLHEIAGLPDLPRRWSVDDHAADLVALLGSEEARRARVDALRGVIARHAWSGFADGLVDFFGRITRMPEAPTSAVGADGAAADAAALSAILSSRTWRATAPLRRLARRRR